MADINVTPLVDVVLVLLIIFMIVTPMLASPVEVTLPQAKKTEEAKDLGSRVVVFIGPEAQVFVGRAPATKETLMPAIQEAFKTKENHELLVKADINLKWRDVSEVLTTIKDGGVNDMFLATRKSDEE